VLTPRPVFLCLAAMPPLTVERTLMVTMSRVACLYWKLSLTAKIRRDALSGATQIAQFRWIRIWLAKQDLRQWQQFTRFDGD